MPRSATTSGSPSPRAAPWAIPSTRSDGQKITFQVTQGAAGSSAITWGSTYEFSDGLPQPVLSSAAGKTDLLAFIYNGDKSKWLLAAFVNGFSSTVITQPKGTYRLFPSTGGPSTPVSYSGAFMRRRGLPGHHGRGLV